MNPVTRYQATDGTVFETSKEAEAHEVWRRRNNVIESMILKEFPDTQNKKHCHDPFSIRYVCEFVYFALRMPKLLIEVAEYLKSEGLG
jgi:hypothetical protein